MDSHKTRERETFQYKNLLFVDKFVIRYSSPVSLLIHGTVYTPAGFIV